MRIHTLLLLLLGLTACGLQTTPPPPVDDTGSASFGDLTVSTTSLDFGLVLMGETGEATLNLGNTGSDSLTILDAQLDNTAFQFMDAATLLPLEIASGSEVDLTLSFTPDSPIDFEGELTLVTDIAEAPEVIISLYGSADESSGGDDTGVAAGGVLSLSATSVDFGGVETSETGSAPLTISNIGDEDILLINFTASETMWGYGGELALPYVLEAGQSRDITLTAVPDEEKTYTGSITVVTDATIPEIVIPTTVLGTHDYDGPLLMVYNAQDYSSELGFGLFGGTSGKVKLANEGDQPLTVDSVGTTSDVDADCTYVVSGFSGPKLIEPDQDFEISVAYNKGTADACALASGTLDVISDGGNVSFPLWVFGG